MERRATRRGAVLGLLLLLLAWPLRTAGHTPFNQFVGGLKSLDETEGKPHDLSGQRVELYFLQTDAAVNLTNPLDDSRRMVHFPVSAVGWRAVTNYGQAPELTAVQTFMAAPPDGDDASTADDTAACCLYKGGPGMVMAADEIDAALWGSATFMAVVPTAVYRRFWTWLEQFDKTHSWHMPLQVESTLVDAGPFVASASSHDFVWAALRQLAGMGVDLTPVIPTVFHRTDVSTSAMAATWASATTFATATDTLDQCIMAEEWASGVSLTEFVHQALSPCLASAEQFVVQYQDTEYYRVTGATSATVETSAHLPKPHYFSENGGSWVDWLLTVIVLGSFIIGVWLLFVKCGLKVHTTAPYVECNRRSPTGHEQLGKQRLYEMLNYRMNAPQRLVSTPELPTSPRRFIRVRGAESERNEEMLLSTVPGRGGAADEPDSADDHLLLTPLTPTGPASPPPPPPQQTHGWPAARA